MTSLAERLKAVPYVCGGRDDCTTTEHGASICGHDLVPHWEVLAAEALAHVREVLSREKIIQELIKQFGLDCKVCDPKWYAPMADAILRLLDGEASDGS